MKIRILPMSLNDEEFIGKSVEDVQKTYFEHDLMEKYKGWYEYPTKGLDASEGDLILFQLENQIVASAEFYMNTKFKRISSSGYKGAIIVNNVKVFKPITLDEFCEITESINRFGNATYSIDENDIDMAKLNDYMKRELN